MLRNMYCMCLSGYHCFECYHYLRPGLLANPRSNKSRAHHDSTPPNVENLKLLTLVTHERN